MQFFEFHDQMLQADQYTIIEKGPPYLRIVWHSSKADMDAIPSWFAATRLSALTPFVSLDIDMSLIGLN